MVVEPVSLSRRLRQFVQVERDADADWVKLYLMSEIESARQRDVRRRLGLIVPEGKYLHLCNYDR